MDMATDTRFSFRRRLRRIRILQPFPSGGESEERAGVGRPWSYRLQAPRAEHDLKADPEFIPGLELQRPHQGAVGVNCGVVAEAVAANLHHNQRADGVSLVVERDRSRDAGVVRRLREGVP